MKQQDRWSILGSRLTVKNVEAINCDGFVKRRVRDRSRCPRASCALNVWSLLRTGSSHRHNGQADRYDSEPRNDSALREP